MTVILIIKYIIIIYAINVLIIIIGTPQKYLEALKALLLADTTTQLSPGLCANSHSFVQLIIFIRDVHHEDYEVYTQL